MQCVQSSAFCRKNTTGSDTTYVPPHPTKAEISTVVTAAKTSDPDCLLQAKLSHPNDLFFLWARFGFFHVWEQLSGMTGRSLPGPRTSPPSPPPFCGFAGRVLLASPPVSILVVLVLRVSLKI